MSEQFDIVIIGGGLVGVTLSLALAPLGLNIAIVEAHTEQHFQTSHLDVRSLALSYGSAKILQGIGIWSAVKEHVTPIEHIHVSDRGHFGMTRLGSEQAKVPALGYVIEVPALLKVLYQQLATTTIKSFSPAKLLSLQQNADQVDLLIDCHDKTVMLQAKIVLGADGGKSTVRQLLEIEADEYDYQQIAIVSNIAIKRDHANQAYERFTEEGPLALLPLSNKRMSMIWTVKQEQAADIMSQTDAEFLENLQKTFGYRAGRFEVIGQRQTFPLKQLQVSSHFKGRVGLIGNSAHSLHPVVGQGFNLSMRDIAELADTIAEACLQDMELDQRLFERYIERRKKDHSIMLKLTDSLIKTFSTQSLVWSLFRNIALHKIERISPIKAELNTLMMGMRGRLNRLARGLPLKQGQPL